MYDMMAFDNSSLNGHGHRDSIELDAPPTTAASNEIHPQFGEVAVSQTNPPSSPESVAQHQAQQNGVATGNQVTPEEAPKEEPEKHEPQKVGRPQVIVRIRPSTCLSLEDKIFEIDEETKTLQIKVEKDIKPTDPRHNPFQCAHTFINFPTDGILENSTQEDVFKCSALEIVEKAMEGISGIIVGVGPEGAGKTFSLFGLNGKYANRGIAGRIIEKAFEIKEKKVGETEFRLGIGIIEVRRERIRDLVTLSPYEINEVGNHGPKGMHVEEMDCFEHGIGILLRALIGQKMIHKEPYELYHTIMYLEIVALNPDTTSPMPQFRSRITLAEIAAAPPKPRRYDPPMRNNSFSNHQVNPFQTSSVTNTNGGACISSNKIETLSNINNSKPRIRSSMSTLRTSRCMNPGYSTGPLAESIAVRRDTFALEQIFLKAHELHRLRKYFAKLEELGLSMIASEKRKLSNTHNFRQSRLAHCLKDIMEGNTEIRILLHVIPSKSNLKASLEAMRFAERAKLVPTNAEEEVRKGKKDRPQDQILQEVLSEIAPDVPHPINVESLSLEKMKSIQEQAVQYFENNIDGMKVCSKDKVKQMFENFRVLWNFLFELELNINLRKAEDEFKTNLESQGISYPISKRRSSNQGKDDSVDGGYVGDEEDRDRMTHYYHSKEGLHGKKSSKKVKKDKEKKKKKDKGKKESQPELKPLNPTDPVEQKDSLTNLEHADETIVIKSPEEEEEDEEIQAAPSEPNLVIPEVITKEVSAQPPVDTESQEKSQHQHHHQHGAAGRNSKDQGTQFGVAEAAAISAASTKHNSLTGGMESNADVIKSPAGAAFGEFKFANQDNASHQDLSEEEKAALAAKMEDQFEEMKKIAKRQAIHLLKAGDKRPEWFTLF